jgi:hypothetical protein
MYKFMSPLSKYRWQSSTDVVAIVIDRLGKRPAAMADAVEAMPFEVIGWRPAGESKLII